MMRHMMGNAPQRWMEIDWKALKERLFGESRWIPWLFVGMFTIIISVNAVMVTVGFTTWTGLSTKSHYREGLAYNRALEAARSQEALGWQLDLKARATAPMTLSLELSAKDAQGLAFQQAEVTAFLTRPTHEGADLAVLLEPVAEGRFAAVAELPLAGQWDVKLLVQAEGHSHQSFQRVFVKP